MKECGAEDAQDGGVRETSSTYRVDLVARGLAPAQGAPVCVSPSARPYLTGPLAEIVDRAVVFLTREANRKRMPATAFLVSRYTDPEDGTNSLVLAQKVAVSPEKALEYWTTASQALATFFSSQLPDDLGRVAAESVAFEVTWDDGNPSVPLR